MINTKITIQFNNEKISAIKQFSEKAAPAIETQLSEYLEKIYQKTVPAPVRQYIDSKATAQPKVPSQEKKKQSGDTE